MAKEKVSYNHLMVLASGEYLTEYLPDNWHKWSEKKADKFVEEHAWEPFEDWSADEVWGLIAQTTNLMQKCIENYSEVNYDR